MAAACSAPWAIFSTSWMRLSTMPRRADWDPDQRSTGSANPAFTGRTTRIARAIETCPIQQKIIKVRRERHCCYVLFFVRWWWWWSWWTTKMGWRFLRRGWGQYARFVNLFLTLCSCSRPLKGLQSLVTFSGCKTKRRAKWNRWLGSRRKTLSAIRTIGTESLTRTRTMRNNDMNGLHRQTCVEWGRKKLLNYQARYLTLRMALPLKTTWNWSFSDDSG